MSNLREDQAIVSSNTPDLTEVQYLRLQNQATVSSKYTINLWIQKSFICEINFTQQARYLFSKFENKIYNLNLNKGSLMQ